MVRTARNGNENTPNPIQQSGEATINQREQEQNVQEQREENSQQGRQRTQRPPQIQLQENRNTQRGNMRENMGVQQQMPQTHALNEDEFGPLIPRSDETRNLSRQQPHAGRRVQERPAEGTTVQNVGLEQAQRIVGPAAEGGQVQHQRQTSRQNTGGSTNVYTVLPQRVAAQIHRQNINLGRNSMAEPQRGPTILTGYGGNPIRRNPQAQEPSGQVNQPTEAVSSRNPVWAGPAGYGPAPQRFAQRERNPYDQIGPMNQSLADILGNEINGYQDINNGNQQQQNQNNNIQPPLGAGNQNSWNTGMQQPRNTVFSYPTPANGELARAMSQITCNHTSAASGMGNFNNNLQQGIDDHIKLALAVQLGANGPQMVKQRALLNVLTSKPARGDMQQVLQSRAALYGDSLDPKWFNQGIDLGGKTKSIIERNKARAMLVAAPLLVAQVGAYELRTKMMVGYINALRGLRIGTTMTVAQLLKQLGSAPPMAVLKLCNKATGDFVMENMVQHSQDLDYTQDVLTAVGNHTELNPTMHAVISGFNSRRNTSRFKNRQQSMDLECLRFAHTATPKDSDQQVVKQHQNGNGSGSNTRRTGDMSQAICRFFQRQPGCRTPGRCRYDHRCIICGNSSHGAVQCYSRPGGGARQNQATPERRWNARMQEENDTPPDPRRRRNRARTA